MTTAYRPAPITIASIIHDANRRLQIALGEPVISPLWEDAPDWQRESAIDGVNKALDGLTPEQLHENWSEYRKNDGWVYGEVKDEVAKTHPCLVPYAELPAEQRIKDTLFHAIVNALHPRDLIPTVVEPDDGRNTA